jgi:MFS family permease
MELQRQHLQQASDQGLLTPEQITPLWQYLEALPTEQAFFRATHILFYLGGLIAMAAMSLFMTLGWNEFGGIGIFLIACGYGVAACLVADWLLWRQRQPIPAGLLAAIAVTMVPLAIYGLQDHFGYWAGSNHAEYRDFHRYIDWRWLMMEFGTLLFGSILLWRYRLPFMVMPLAVVLWYLSMDLTPFLFQNEDSSWHNREQVSMIVGLLMLGLAFYIDLKTRYTLDYAWWLYLFGLMAFWGGMSMQHSDSELNKLIYCVINLGLVAVGGMIGRRVFAVFGGMGIAGYLGYLAWDLFQDSLTFPFVLSLIGLGIIWLGLVWQRNELKIQALLQQYLPTAWRELLAQRR